MKFQKVGGSLALDFVNTVGNRLAGPSDYWQTPEDLLAWAAFVALAAPGDRVPTVAELAEARGVREQLYALLHPVAGGEPLPAQTAAKINRWLRACVPAQQIERSGGNFRWRTNRHAGALGFLGPVMLSAAGLLVSGDYRQIRQCQDEACGWLFLDRSQAHRRRWCSMGDCGNRAKARRHYYGKVAGRDESAS